MAGSEHRYQRLGKILKEMRPILDVYLIEIDDEQTYVAGETGVVLPNNQVSLYLEQLNRENTNKRLMVSVFSREEMRMLNSYSKQKDNGIK